MGPGADGRGRIRSLKRVLPNPPVVVGGEKVQKKQRRKLDGGGVKNN